LQVDKEPRDGAKDEHLQFFRPDPGAQLVSRATHVLRRGLNSFALRAPGKRSFDCCR
jgi:hypothetical protein